MAGLDDTVFVTQRNELGESRIAAYLHSKMVWAVPLKQCGSTAGMGISALSLGPDGGVYALAENYGGGPCSGTISVIGLNAKTGARRLQTSSVPADIRGVEEIYTQDRGLIVKTYKQLFFFSYGGTYRSAETIDLPENEGLVAASADGRNSVAFAIVGAEDTTCGSDPSHTVVMLKRGSAEPYRLSIPGCKSPTNLWVKPDGRVAYTYYGLQLPNGDPDIRLVQRGPSGTADFDISLSQLAGFNVSSALQYRLESGAVTISNNGNYYIRRQVSRANVINPDTDLRVDRVNSAGKLTSVFSTEAFNTKRTQYFGYSSTDDGGMAGKYLLIPYCVESECLEEGNAGRVAVVGETAGTAYPRSASLTAAARTLDYVALGDSFSSGEGVPPFDSSTNTKKDQCHRSTRAYSRRLDTDRSLMIKLRANGFRACSGATTAQVVNGKDTERGQLDAITSATDVVTISVGGNDVDFEQFVAACLTPSYTSGCSRQSQIYTQTVDKIELRLPTRLDVFYAKLEKKLDSVRFSGTVYVVGYPKIMVAHPLGGGCPLELSQAEGEAADDLAIRLDREISAAVARLDDDRFEYVSAIGVDSPFAGHDMCSLVPYFNNYDPRKPKVFTAHPNFAGQVAYAKLLAGHGIG